MKFVILDNTGWTTHFDALQLSSRAAETASAASRRASNRLVRWTPPASSPAVLPPLHPYTFERSCAMTPHVHRYNFFSHFSRSPFARMRRRTRGDARSCSRGCHIRPAAKTPTPACRGRRALPNGDRCATCAYQNVSQSSPPAAAATAACAGAADAAEGLRADVAIAVRLTGPSRTSRSSRAAAGADAATGAAVARGF